MNPKKSRYEQDDVVKHSEADDEENRGFSPEYYSDVVGRDADDQEATDVQENPLRNQEQDYEKRKLDDLLNDNL